MTALLSRLRLSAYSVVLTCTIFSRSTLRCAGAHTASRTMVEDALAVMGSAHGARGFGTQAAGEEGACAPQVGLDEVRCALDLGSGATKMSTGRFAAGHIEMIASEVRPPFQHTPTLTNRHENAPFLLYLIVSDTLNVELRLHQLHALFFAVAP